MHQCAVGAATVTAFFQPSFSRPKKEEAFANFTKDDGSQGTEAFHPNSKAWPQHPILYLNIKTLAQSLQGLATASYFAFENKKSLQGVSYYYIPLIFC